MATSSRRIWNPPRPNLSYQACITTQSGSPFLAVPRRLIGTNASHSPVPGVNDTVSPSKHTPLRGLAAVRARPLLHILSFGLLHQSIAWAALPPLFYFFQTTGAATSLLAGPQVAWVLSRPVPNWLPLPFVDKKEAYQKAISGDETEAEQRKAESRVIEVKASMASAITGWIKGNKDISRLSGAVGADKELEKLAREGKEAEARARAKGEKPLLVEDVVEQVIRKAVRMGFTFSRSIYGQAKSWGKNEDELAEEAIKTLEGKDSRALRIPDFGLGDRVRKTAQGVSFREILDGAAAYIVVKALFPARLPISLFLTPKFARILSRALGR